MSVPISLYARALRPLGEVSKAPFVARISEDRELSGEERAASILLVRQPQAELPTGFRAYLTHQKPHQGEPLRDVFLLGHSLHYLAGGDIVRIDPARQSVNTIYRRESNSNSLLLTERCDNYCIMCSQPPKRHNDDWLVDELIRDVIPLLSPETSELGLTGGEPSLLGTKLLRLVQALQEQLPKTALHLLSNGRGFADGALAQQLGQLRHPDLLVGVPLYSDLPEEHDFVVQAPGAFDETVRGILQLKRAHVGVELRFVTLRQTVQRLPDFARFVARNLAFVDHVSLMGLEQVGFGKANLDEVWVDPLDYADTLREAVFTLERAGLSVAIFGHQLCTLSPAIRHIATKAISDWKNEYAEECADCAKRERCGGFFSSSLQTRSRGIKAFQ